MEAHESNSGHEESVPHGVARNKFVILIAGTITIALVLVFISLSLYAASGAAQLDLSRPDYKSIRDQISEDGEYAEAYPSTGSMDKQAIEDFRKLYKDAVHQATSVPVFGPSALSDESLSISTKKKTAR